ncbi:Telomere-associated protein RIF1 [Holothuria leucospilota]|uniref:Telomere-associated protein RIF1 n=1 Tax=Holothuria leucospilota TaxID=206669 RepID=A0A9Q1BG49_HOLLE|nr:Telomere-associated protein RIF1 [Holothuria leucospilota]
MMVTCEDEPIPSNAPLAPILTKLKNEEIPSGERVDIYSSLAGEFQKDDISATLETLGREAQTLTTRFCEDIQNDQKELNQSALRVLGLCLHYEETAKSFSEGDSRNILTALCNTVLKTEDKSTCTRALWCLSRQQLPSSIIKSELHNILCALEHVLQQTKFQSVTAEYEAVNLLIRLLEQLPDVMTSFTIRWAPMLFPLIVHSAHKLREKAHQATQLALPAIRKHQAELAPLLVVALKSTIIVDMAELFTNKQEHYVLQVWKLYMDLLGKALHKGGSLINLMLRVVEQGFKHGFPEIKRESFQAWKTLIDNFALDLDVLSNAKRLKLLMQPFLATSTKQESVAIAKFDAWWHLCIALGPRLASNFEVVLAPLLQFCLGFTHSASYSRNSTPSSSSNRHSFQSVHRSGGLKALAMTSPATTPRMSLSSPSRSGETFKSLIIRGAVVLSYLLSCQDMEVNCQHLRLQINDPPQPLAVPVLSRGAMVFIKIAARLTPIVKDTIQHHRTVIGDEICVDMFSALTQQVKTALENTQKKDNGEMFGSFLSHLQDIIKDSEIQPAMLLKFMDCLKGLPTKVLSSSAYLSWTAGCVLHGTPTLFLLELLFSPHLLKASSDERYFLLLEHLVACGMSNQSSVLEFTSSYMSLLDKVAVSDCNNKEILWRMWSVQASPLLDHIMMTNEVNQGDSFEHEFSALISCLIFPIQKILPFGIPLPTTKTLLKTWTDLYQAFTRCAAMVTTAGENQCCQDLCSKIVDFTVDENVHLNLPFLEALFHILRVMLDSVDFSVYSNQQAGLQSPVTPGKWGKKRHKPLRNLSSFVKLLSHMIYSFHKQRACQAVTFLGNTNQAYLSSWTTIVSNCCHIVTALFSHISRTSILQQLISKLAKPLSGFFGDKTNFPSNELYKTNLLPKLDKLWQDILMGIQARFPGPYDSESLEVFEPIFDATLSSPHRSIRNHTLLFWSATFAKADSLQYSERMKICLQKVQEKNDVALPGWSDVEIMESTDSTSPSLLAPQTLSPSPRKIHGSFLQRPEQAKQLFISSSPFKSPGKSPLRSKNISSPAKEKLPARRRLHIEEENTQDFVFIAPSPKKKQVLTEHQKEMLKEKRVIPALYNDLEQSQDTELFSDLTQTQSQFPDRLSDKGSAARPEEESTTLMDAFTALKKTEAANAEVERQTSPPKKPVLDKKVTFSEDYDNSKPKADKGSDYFVARMNEKIESLKKAIKKGIKESVTSGETVIMIDDTPDPLATEKIEDQSCKEDDELMEVTSNEGMETKTENNSVKVERKFGTVASSESLSVIPETQIDLTEKSSSIPIAEILSSPLDSLLKTPPKSESFPFQVDEEFDLTNITIPDDQVSPFVKISTPVVKVHKLDMTIFQTQHTLEVEKSKVDKIRKAGQTTPIITPSPSGSQTPQETPRFRRYKSDEIHTRSLRSGGKVRKWHSFEDLNPESPKGDFSPVDPDTNVFSLHSLSSGLISEKADLDGIHPLDCSFDHEEVEKEIVKLAEKEVGDDLPDCVFKEGVPEQTPTLRRGKRQRKVKEFSDFITPQKLLSTILPSQENSCEDQPERDQVSQDVAEDLEDEKRGEVEDSGKDKDEGEQVIGNEVCEKREEISPPQESTQELFTAEESMEEESARDEMDTQEDKGEVVGTKLSGDVVEAVLKEDGKEENGESSKSEKESLEEKLEERLEDEDSNDEKPLSSFRGRKRKKLRRKRKVKSENVETINLCNSQSQSQDAVGHEKCKEDGSLSQNEAEKNVNGDGQKSGDNMNIKEDQLGATEDKEYGITDGMEIKAGSPTKKRRKKSQTVDVESSLEGKEKELECPVESDGKVCENQFEEMEKGDRSGGEKEVVVPIEERKYDEDETVLEMGESVEAKETSFNSEDEIPLTHLQKNIGDPNREIASQDAKEVEMCSVNDKKGNEEEANTGEEEISEKGGDCVSGEDAQKVTKGTNNRRRKSGRQRHPISPKIRRNLTERFQKAKHVSPKSNQFQSLVVRKKTKHSPKMLRSKGPIGTLKTRLRFKGDNSQNVPLTKKKIRILKKNKKGKEKSKLLQDADDVNGAKVIVGVTNETKETVSMTTDVKEVEAIVCPNQESVGEKQSNIVSNGEENVSCKGMVSMETDITHSVNLKGNDRDTNDSESAQTIGKENLNTSQSNDPVGEAEIKEQYIESSSNQSEKEPECLQSAQENKCKDDAGSEEEDVRNSSCSPTKQKQGGEDIEESNTGSAMHAGKLPFLDGEGSESKAGSDGSNSPVIQVKLISRLCSSPIAAHKVQPSGERSPELVGVGSIYSPSVSPSNGILKKKDDTCSNSPSPTNKNRRVKFSDKVSTKEIENCTPSRSSNKQRLIPGSPSSGRGRTSSTLHPSPLVTTTPSRVVNLQSKYITTPSRTAEDRNDRITNSSSRRVTPKFKSHSHRYKSSKSHRRAQPASLTPPTQGTPSSQLNSSLDEEGDCQESIFPELLDCKAPVEEILPQLTSSMWSRGLGQLVRARNIFTIGQLSALTPSEVQSLPIRSPKVSHLKWVLGQYLQRLQTKTSDEGIEAQDTVPPVSEENSKLEGESTAETLSLKRKRGNSEEASESLSEPDAKKTKLVEQLEKLSEDLNVEVLRSVSPQQLFKAHSHINSLMDSIMGVLKSKYQSSPSTS